MKTLFIDTHDENLLILINNDGKIFESKILNNKNHSEIVIPTIINVLSDSKLSLRDINLIIVVNGPGSFTGVRIGVTIAKTIAYSLNIPIKTITSLEAYGVSESKLFNVITVRDSKGVYSATYSNNVFENFEYRKNVDFEAYIKSNNFVVSENRLVNIDKVIEYLKDKKSISPHLVIPIYIKEIEALK